MKTHLMAGAAEVTITSIKDRPDVYAELYARALVLADGEKQLAIVTADYGQFPLQYNSVLLDAIHQATDIPPEHVVINCSHTHNAPGVDGRWITEAEASEAWLATCLAERTHHFRITRSQTLSNQKRKIEGSLHNRFP